MPCSALSTIAKSTLWGLLGEEYPEEGTTTAKALATVPKRVRGSSGGTTCRRGGRA